MSETEPETRQKLNCPAWKPDGNPMEIGQFPLSSPQEAKGGSEWTLPSLAVQM